MNKYMTKQKFKSALDGKAGNTGIYKALRCGYPIGGRYRIDRFVFADGVVWEATNDEVFGMRKRG